MNTHSLADRPHSVEPSSVTDGTDGTEPAAIADQPSVADIRRQVRLVLDVLRTSSRTKRHGSYEWYHDADLTLWRDTYTSALAVTLPDCGDGDGDGVTVFAIDSAGVVTGYRPGRWTDHLATLAKAASIIKAERQAARHAAVIAYNRVRFAPVDSPRTLAGAAGRRAG